MRRPTQAAWACSALGLALSGCTGLFTQSAVTAFTRSLETKNLTELKQHTSGRFEELALRRPESVQDLRLISVPSGKVNVASIEKTSPTTRTVRVEVGGTKKPVEYRLTREPRSGRWVVDDVIIAQPKDASGSVMTRTVTDQMNLLLSIRELVDEWQSHDRARVLAAITPQLAHELEGLPPAWLDQLTARVAGDGPLRSFRPEVRMEDDRAVVGLSRGASLVLMEFNQQDGKWLLNNASWTAGADDQVRSMQKLCSSLSQSRRFLEAYAAGEKEALAELATPAFNTNCLESADLLRLPLPVMDLLTRPFEVRYHDRGVDVLLTTENVTYTLNLAWSNDVSNAGGDDGRAVDARIEELTIYDRGDGQVKRMSAVFRSQAVVEVYSEVLAHQNTDQLRQLSSVNFNDVVWKLYRPDLLRRIRIPEIEDAQPKLISTVFQGPVTEVTVMQGSLCLTYVLHGDGSRLVVDDILMPVQDRPASLKKHLQVMGAVYEFVDALRRDDPAALMAASGPALDRIVWQQVKSTPEIGIDLPRRLVAPIVALRVGDTQAHVTLSDGVHVAEVELEEERGRFVVADVNFIEGPGRTPVALLRTMRQQIARDMQSRNAREILPARAESTAGASQLVQPL